MLRAWKGLALGVILVAMAVGVVTTLAGMGMKQPPPHQVEAFFTVPGTTKNDDDNLEDSLYMSTFSSLSQGNELKRAVYSFTAEASITATDVNALVIDVDLPEDWSIISQDPGNGNFKPSENQWVWLGGENRTVTYTVQVPNNASASPGDYTTSEDWILGTYDRWEDYTASKSNIDIQDNTLTIGAGSDSGTWTSTTRSYESKRQATKVQYESDPTWNNLVNHTELIPSQAQQRHNPMPVRYNGSWYLFAIDSAPDVETMVYERTSENNWTLVQKNVIDTEVNDVCVNGQGQLVAYGGYPDGFIDVYVGTNVTNFTRRGQLTDKGGDPGCYYEADGPNAGMHVAYEKDSTGKSGKKVGHFYSSNGITNWTEKPPLYDASDEPRGVGDPRIWKIGDTYHMFTDYNDNQALDDVRHYYSDTLSGPFTTDRIVLDGSETGTVVGDAIPRIIDGKIKVFYETGYGSIWVAESDGVFKENVTMNLSYDGDGDGTLESSTSVDLKSNYRHSTNSYNTKQDFNPLVWNRSTTTLDGVSGYSYQFGISLGQLEPKEDSDADEATLSYWKLNLETGGSNTAPTIDAISTRR